MQFNRRRGLAAGLLGLAMWAGSAVALAADEGQQTDRQDYSAAERLLFMTNQLAGTQPPAKLAYRFSKSGTLEDGFDDAVSIALSKDAEGGCCAASGDFLSGPRRMELPDIPNAQANPVTLYFLEHDVRDMQRLTRGQQNHFRRLIRMAVYKSADVKPVTLSYQGKSVEGQQITIDPYLEDPSRNRYEKFARKRYSFLLSPQVPGGVYAIRSAIASPGADGKPLIAEELVIDGGVSTAPAAASTAAPASSTSASPTP